MRLLISLISFMLLTACASTPMSVYLDAPENGTQVKKPVTIKVNEITPRALNKVLAYHMGVHHHQDGYRKTSTLNPTFSRNGVLLEYNYLRNTGKWARRYVNFLGDYTKSNTTLDNEDISIFELKIIGISSGVETVVSKRFTGPVKRFNWIELFENKVPEDQSGYLLTGTAYINYIPIFESPSNDSSPAVIEKEHKQYLVPIPMMFSVEKEYRDSIYKGVISSSKSQCLFGTHPQVPMAKIFKTNLMKDGVQIFNSGSNFLQSIKIDSGRSCDRRNDTAVDIFENKIIKIGGKFYPHTYLLNKNFVTSNLFLNKPFYKTKARKKNIKDAAMHLAYEDDLAMHEINRTMSDARSALGELSGSCKRGVKRMKKLANSWSILGISRSDKNRRYGRYDYLFGNIKNRIQYYQNNITKASVKFESLAAQQSSIQASTSSLEDYNAEVSMIPKSLNSAKIFCAQLGSAVSALGNGSYKSTQSFMSILAGTLQNSYRKSARIRAGYSAPEAGSSESLTAMWSGFRQANKKSMEAIRLSRLNQVKKNSEYLNSLQQVRDNYRRTGKVPTLKTPTSKTPTSKTPTSKQSQTSRTSRSNGNSQLASRKNSICTSTYKGLKVMPSVYSESASGQYEGGREHYAPWNEMRKKATAQCKSKGASGTIMVGSKKDIKCDKGKGEKYKYSTRNRFNCSVSSQYYCTCGGGK